MKNEATNVPAAATSALKPYQIVDEVSGEVRPKYKYLTGAPRQYRFDAKEGVFNINGVQKLSGPFTFQPIAWRIFTDNILNMGTKRWAELFFIDEKKSVSAILFHGYSVDNIMRLVEDFYYDDITLADVVLTATPERKENNKIQPKGVYHIANFTYVPADPSVTAELTAFAQDFKIYRSETLTDVANTQYVHNYHNPFAHGLDYTEQPALPAATA